MLRSVPPSDEIHPFLKGNFAPVTEEYVDYACEVVQGRIPGELLGGQYIRNGGNPVYPPDKGRHYHWFDGDGMLHGVYFADDGKSNPMPRYTNRHLATPLLDLTLLLLRSPIPSIALLISPLSSLPRILSAIVQAFMIALRARMGVLSVANTSVIWWGAGLGVEAEEERELDDDPLLEVEGSQKGSTGGDGRLLATCESGPPLEVRVPGLETVGWDRLKDSEGETLDQRRGKWEWFKRWGLSRVQEDWMTAHPRVDPVDGSFIFYSTQMFDSPHARYSVIDRYGHHVIWKHGVDIGRAKMMHDFGCTRTHTILLNLPLTLSPANLFSIRPRPLIHFDRTLHSEYVIFPRMEPDRVVRFIDPEPCLIFHTANSWDEVNKHGRVEAINMLGCRFKSAKLVYSAGAVDVPKVERAFGKEDIVQLYYYRFVLPTSSHIAEGTISHAFPLTAIPFEFPTVPAGLNMSECRYVYGCTMASGSFDERLGGAAKVDCLVKIDVLSLIEAGRRRVQGKSDEPIDPRSAAQIVHEGRTGRQGPVSIFQCPPGWYAQEPRFVTRHNARDEDDGYLLTYVYNEQYLTPDGTPSTSPGTGSELWVIDAKRMHLGVDAITCRIKLPQRVPYGLHGTWLPPNAFRTQRPLPQPLDPQPLLQDKLARSRLQHFVSIIFDRPPTRDKSLFERVILAFMYPAALVLLLIAVYEAFRWCRPEKRSSSLVDNFSDNDEASHLKSERILPPYLLEGAAIAFLSLSYWLWPAPDPEVVEVSEPDP